MVPIAKADSDFDSFTFCTIAVCTLSTSTNVANWLFSMTYFRTSHKFAEIIDQQSQMRPSVYDSPATTQSNCLDKLCTFWAVTLLFFIDELCLASILFYDYKKVLAGDTSIRQEEVKLSLTVFLGIKNVLAFWTTVLLVRSVWNIKTSLARCG